MYQKNIWPTGTHAKTLHFEPRRPLEATPGAPLRRYGLGAIGACSLGGAP